jgi:DNA end-binding protein Ku
MQIAEFVRFVEVDPVYLETSYYVVPDVGGDKPYPLLFEARKKTGYAAIGELVMHRRDQIIVMRPGEHGLIAHTLFYEDEVKRENEYHIGSGLTGGKEMDLAIKLVDALSGKFEPAKFKDQYRERIRQAISQKVESGEVKQSANPATPRGPVVDIMAALTESLSRIKKPVASESKPAAGKRTKRSGGR